MVNHCAILRLRLADRSWDPDRDAFMPQSQLVQRELSEGLQRRFSLIKSIKHSSYIVHRNSVRALVRLKLVRTCQERDP